MKEIVFKQPEVDAEKLQKAANEAAEKAFLKVIDEYYARYDSPYQKMIKEELSKQQFSFNFTLPDILGKLNEALTAEVDRIANNAIAQTYIPLLSKTFVRIKKDIKWSEVLRKIIEELEPDYDDFGRFKFEYEKHAEYGWLKCFLQTNENSYNFTLHSKEYKKDTGKYCMLSFPRNDSKYSTTIKIYKDDVRIEIPFTHNILHDKVLMIFMQLMISNSVIEMDCENFDDDMFPENESND